MSTILKGTLDSWGYEETKKGGTWQSSSVSPIKHGSPYLPQKGVQI